jgi:hypothetical protein
MVMKLPPWDHPEPIDEPGKAELVPLVLTFAWFRRSDANNPRRLSVRVHEAVDQRLHTSDGGDSGYRLAMRVTYYGVPEVDERYRLVHDRVLVLDVCHTTALELVRTMPAAIDQFSPFLTAVDPGPGPRLSMQDVAAAAASMQVGSLVFDPRGKVRR